MRFWSTVRPAFVARLRSLAWTTTLGVSALAVNGIVASTAESKAAVVMERAWWSNISVLLRMAGVIGECRQAMRRWARCRGAFDRRRAEFHQPIFASTNGRAGSTNGGDNSVGRRQLFIVRAVEPSGR